MDINQYSTHVYPQGLVQKVKRVETGNGERSSLKPFPVSEMVTRGTRGTACE
jgi:hypothetical protein